MDTIFYRMIKAKNSMKFYFLEMRSIGHEIIYLPYNLHDRYYQPCPGGEIGKRCGLRSRWEQSLESSSLSPGTNNILNIVEVCHQK